MHSILCTNAWRKYFRSMEEPPVFFVFSSSDEMALEAGRVINDFSQINKYRLSTDDRMQNDLLKKGSFLKYDSNIDMLKATKATIFKPEETVDINE